MNTTYQPEVVADEIIKLYQEFGMSDYIGEPVSQIEHMSQCAEYAIAAGSDNEIILGAFFHDIGHLYAYVKSLEKMGTLGIVEHEKYGADYLRSLGFSEKIARLVEGHVAAKRYLTAISNDYYNDLSESSKKTLEYQGGKMNKEEAQLFEQDELFEWHIQLRRWDDLGKKTNRPLLPLAYFKDLIIRSLSSN